MKARKGILLVNLGTPDSPSVADVRKYLREFLMDERVIDIPFVSRWWLVNLIIAPFRSPKSAKEYAKLWDERGSPLKYFGEDITTSLQKKLGDDYVVKLGMRYQNPSIELVLNQMNTQGVSEIIIIPLFPQYASATTGSVIQKVNEVINKWQAIPALKFVNKFFDYPPFIEAFSENGRKMLNEKTYDHVVFSYHGLPERQIEKSSREGYCKKNDSCCSSYHSKNRLCYRAQCFETSRLLAASLGLGEEKYTTTFQSRLGKDPWIQPYTDAVLQQLPQKGIKKVLVFSPAFIADCLETTVEVGETFKDLFLEAGGEVWDLVPSLNNNDVWVECLASMVTSKIDFIKK
ncbi:MAG: ferrochelatase [Cyclobacteriaceae bacterium]|nr:ferrochelatase [Cyclobacteriaceae bacterium]